MTMLCKIPFLLVFLLASSTILMAQKQTGIFWDLELNVHASDLNYGSDIAFAYIQNGDYLSTSASSDAGLGYSAAIAGLYGLSRKSAVRVSAGYTALGEDVRGMVRELREGILRPPSGEIPITVDGSLNYSFIELGADFMYQFHEAGNSGVSASAGIGYLINLGVDWKVDVTYETEATGQLNKLPRDLGTDLNDLVMANLRIGYDIAIDGRNVITPMVGVDLGLNGITDDTLSPSMYTIGVRVSKLR